MMATAGLAACVLAVVYDTLLRRIPNWLTLPLMAAGPLLWLFNGPDRPHHALLAAAAVAIAMMAGSFLHGMRVLGGGDIKLLAALVGFVPTSSIATLVCGTALAGGALAIGIALWRRSLRSTVTQTSAALYALAATGQVAIAPSQVSNRTNVPYAWAIAAGFILATFWRP